MRLFPGGFYAVVPICSCPAHFFREISAKTNIFATIGQNLSHQFICTKIVPLFHLLRTSFAIGNRQIQHLLLFLYLQSISRKGETNLREKAREKKNILVSTPTTYPLPLVTSTYFWIGNLKPVSTFFAFNPSFCVGQVLAAGGGK